MLKKVERLYKRVREGDAYISAGYSKITLRMYKVRHARKPSMNVPYKYKIKNLCEDG